MADLGLVFFILRQAKSQIVAVILSTAIDGLSQHIRSVFSQIYPFFLGTLYPESKYLPMVTLMVIVMGSLVLLKRRPHVQ